MRDLPNLSLSFAASKSEWNTQLGVLHSQEPEGISAGEGKKYDAVVMLAWKIKDKTFFF